MKSTAEQIKFQIREWEKIVQTTTSWIQQECTKVEPSVSKIINLQGYLIRAKRSHQAWRYEEFLYECGLIEDENYDLHF